MDPSQLSSALGSALSLGFYDTLCRTSPFIFILYPLMSVLKPEPEDSPEQSLARRNHASIHTYIYPKPPNN